MLMIRPNVIADDVLSESNLTDDLPGPWFADRSYAEGDLVALGRAPVVIANAANTTVVAIGGGVYSAEKTGGSGGVYDASARAAAGFSGDFLVRIASAAVGSIFTAGVNGAPAASNSYEDIELQFAANGANWFVYVGSNQVVGAHTGAFAFIWRHGDTTYAGVGSTFEEAAAAPLYTTLDLDGVSVYFDSSISSAGGKFEAIAIGLSEWPSQPIMAYRSLAGSNLGNAPASSPSSWARAGDVYPVWSPRAAYANEAKAIGLGLFPLYDFRFEHDLSGWSAVGAGDEAWFEGAAARLTGNGTGSAQLERDVATVVGRRYRLTVDVSAYSGPSGWYVGAGGGPGTGDWAIGPQTASGRQVADFIAVGVTTKIILYVFNGSGTTSADFLRVQIEEVLPDGQLYESVAGDAVGVPITIASPGVVTFVEHGAVADTPVSFETTGALPTGLVAGTLYYVKSPTSHTFQVSATPGGAAINTSGSQSGAHRAYLSPNIANRPDEDDGSNWIALGATNRWAMFDNVVGTATVDPSQIDFTLELTGRVDSLALLNLVNVVSVQVIVTVDPEGEVYNETFDLTSTEGIVNWYAWFTDDIIRQSSLLLTDLPTFSDPTVQVIITGTGTADLEVGHFAIGRRFDLGDALHDGLQVGIVDYSRKEADDFGNYEIVERPYSKRASVQTVIAKGQVDAVQNMLAEYRATPAVYSASEDYAALLLLAFYREFSIEIAYPNESLVSIELEGLT